MSDDCESEMSVLKHLWPESWLLLCHFHLLQATWRRWIHAGDSRLWQATASSNVQSCGLQAPLINMQKPDKIFMMMRQLEISCLYPQSGNHWKILHNIKIRQVRPKWREACYKQLQQQQLHRGRHINDIWQFYYFRVCCRKCLLTLSQFTNLSIVEHQIRVCLEASFRVLKDHSLMKKLKNVIFF